MKEEKKTYTICEKCKGQGKRNQKLRKKVRLEYKRKVQQFIASDKKGDIPVKPNPSKSICNICKGTGLKTSKFPASINNVNLPHVSIIGGGIAGTALAVACLHRGIPFTLFERDASFNTRAQGYGLTLQQASKAINGLGIPHLKEGIISTKHIVHNTKGEIIGEWGMRKWLKLNQKKETKRTNIHIARQSLRLALLEQLDGHNVVKWNHKLINFKEKKENVLLNFKTNHETTTVKTDLLVGADGIRSVVRELLIGNKETPLKYLGCIVILGICKLEAIEDNKNHLLDLETVFQTANGNERIYMMPYSSDSIMWQLSYPIPEEEAKKISAKGSKALKIEATQKTPWHHPIPQIIKATKETLISGYPVYDRDLLSSELLKKGSKTTLIGDAAHPMSPFKGQGANQALLDALSLAKTIYKNCGEKFNWKEKGIRNNVLSTFETEMLERSAIKVKASAEAADILHSKEVLLKKDKPRGKH